jgi:biopolymer transport protein ExbD
MLARLGQVICSALVIGAIYLSAAASEPVPGIPATIMPDGTVQIEGARFAVPDAFKAKLTEINARKPVPALHITLAPGANYDALAKAITVAQSMNMKVGILAQAK